MIDSHCHLEMVSEKYSLDEAITNFKNAGGKALLTISTDKQSLDFLKTDFTAYNLPIFISSGWHPHEAASYTPEIENELIKLTKLSNCIAIGEIGLDYHYDNAPRARQREVFERQLEIAKQLHLPVIIHTRDAEPDTLEILDSFQYPHILIHCFTGTMDFAKKCWDRGFLTSFSGIVTFKNAIEIQEAVKNCPKELYLIETDSPFLAPIPMRGKANQPLYVQYVANACASLRGTGVDQVVKETTSNFTRFFRILEPK